MSKGGIKKKDRAPSERSRAARREFSPSLDAGRAVRALSPAAPEKVDSRPSVLAIHHGAGVSKKIKSGRKAAKSFKQRRRQERGIDRAEAVADITANKIARSVDHNKSVRSRNKTWDEVNKSLGGTKTKSKFGFELLGEEDGENDDIKNVIAAPTTSIFSKAAILGDEVDMDDAGVTIITDANEPPVPNNVNIKDDDDEIM
ncbi:Alb1-domain-containing protein [Ceratocystis lukuohia]|uniref:Alb1 n=2 Tax=Ceratocystis TaxID=5157 RepID=A0A0F8B393_CERFI|nr:Alb1 [Ceratocystis platani]